jgi:hypothetical protein
MLPYMLCEQHGYLLNAVSDCVLIEPRPQLILNVKLVQMGQENSAVRRLTFLVADSLLVFFYIPSLLPLSPLWIFPR